MTAASDNRSAERSALGCDIDRIQRLARRHEQAVALLAAEADVGAGLRQADLADAHPIRRENLDAVVALADPSGADPDVAVDVDPQSVRESRLAVEGHVDQRFRIGKLGAIKVVLPDDVLALG